MRHRQVALALAVFLALSEVSAARSAIIAKNIDLEKGSPILLANEADGSAAQLDMPRSLPLSADLKERVHLNVRPLKQPDEMSCWATVYTMMVSWKERRPVTIKEAVARLGEPYVGYLDRRTGLPAHSELEFVSAAGMSAQPPASYPLSFYRKLLRESGPLWVITGNGTVSHARLMTGIYSLNDQESFENYSRTIFEIIDPLTGETDFEMALPFLSDFEREAVVVEDRPWIDLRWQIIVLK
ncbi:papain-like cysteine protease family protein [Rhizobium sp. Leaf383]|uniref:papain-like cysteine protease family protein n=1 Tax=Rhizobium sp. Leaf383 TaxID=1736357 RepID=UPI0007129D3C|nr:papain-like cysteine protease family protein [Rhizobium sp. Leaf383]KQS75961.1 hypothetical protein ASG58_14135 [Rhizobium sp. Leaf383]